MQTEKPRIQRTYVNLVDPVSGDRKHFTVYNATPSDIESKLVGDKRPQDAGECEADAVSDEKPATAA